MGVFNEADVKYYLRKKDKGWQVTVIYPSLTAESGKVRKSKQGFKTKKDANIYALEWVKDIVSSMNLNPVRDSMTVNEFIDVFIASRKNRRENTVKLYKFVGNILIKNFDGRLLKSILPYELEEVFSDYSNSYAVLVRTMFRYAQLKLRILDNNPAENLEGKGTQKEYVTISKDELENNILPLLDDYCRIAVLIAFGSGLRLGEILALTPADIRDNYINVDKQKGASDDITPPKTKNSYRKAVIPRWLADEIRQYISNNSIGSTDCIIPVTKIYFVAKIKSQFLKSDKDKIRKLTMHDFRHSYGSNLIASGVDVATVARSMGDTIDTVIKVYIHATSNATDELIKRIDKIL